jgi:hypothetical protein
MADQVIPPRLRRAIVVSAALLAVALVAWVIYNGVLGGSTKIETGETTTLPSP